MRKYVVGKLKKTNGAPHSDALQKKYVACYSAKPTHSHLERLAELFVFFMGELLDHEAEELLELEHATQTRTRTLGSTRARRGLF